MGLDSVELIMAIEEEFGLEIPDEDAEGLVSVGVTYEYLVKRLNATPPAFCLSQRIFHQLRRALMKNYGLERRQITMDMRLSEIMSPQKIEEGWPFMPMFADLRVPDFPTANKFLLFKLSRETLTIRELVDCILGLNKGRFLDEVDSKELIWRRLVDVVVRQTNVDRHEVTYDAWFTKDLGID